MRYEHTQSAPLPAALVAGAALVAAVLAAASAEPASWVLAGVLVGVAIIAVALSAMTTVVTPDRITVAFRWGRPRRVIPCARVIRVDAVRNRWWHGWGIRWIPGGTMFNVWGLDAVHLELDGARGFRIGTDDPQGLAAAIRESAPANI